MKNPIEPILLLYARLAPRERLALQVAVGATIATILFLVGSSLSEATDRLERRIRAQERTLEHVEQLAERYLAEKEMTDRLAATLGERPKDFSLFSFLESVGSRTVTREKILAMSPSSKTVGDRFVEESVEMRLSQVTLEQVVDLLYEVEQATTPLRVTRIQVKKRYNDEYHFDVTIVISTLVEAA